MLHSNSTTSDVLDRSGPSSGWARTICTIRDSTIIANYLPTFYRAGGLHTTVTMW